MMTSTARLQKLAEDRRRSGRRTMVAEVGVVTSDGGLDVTILDLSETGFRAIVSGELEVGAWVRLMLAQEGAATPEAQVKWRRGSEYGFNFAFPLYAEFVAAALSEASMAEPLVEAAPTMRNVRMSWADYKARRCHHGDDEVSLTPLMAEILSVLMVRRGEAVTGAELARAIWPDEPVAPNRMATLHVIIVRLRERLPGLLTSPSRGSYTVPLPPKAD